MAQAISQQDWNDVYNKGTQAQQATLNAAKKAGTISISQQDVNQPTSNNTQQTTSQIGNTATGNPQYAAPPAYTNSTPGTTVQGSSAFSPNNGTSQQTVQNQSTQSAQPPVTATSLSNPTNNYAYGQNASNIQNSNNGYLDTRNTDLAKYFGGQGISDAKSIQQSLMNNKDYAGADAVDQQNTAQAVADKIALLQKQNQFSQGINNATTNAQNSTNSLNASTQSQLETNNFNMNQGLNNVLSDEQRATQLAKTNESIATDTYANNVRLLNQKVDQARVQSFNQIQDVGEQMRKTVNASNMAGALSGANQSSAFDAGINQIQTDSQKIIDRLGTAQNQLEDYTVQDKQYLLNNYTRDVNSIYQQWAYQNRDFVSKAQTDVQAGLDKYNISDEKLGQYLDEKVIKPYMQANAAAFASYAQGMQTIHSTYNSDIDQVYHMNDLSQQMNKYTTDQLNANNGAALQYMTPSQIDSLVQQGKLSPTDAEIAKANQIEGAVKGLAQYGLPTAEDTAKIQSLIKGGMKPGDAMAQIVQENPQRFTTGNLSVVNMGTDPNTGYPIQGILNPKTGQVSPISPAGANTSNLSGAALYQAMMGAPGHTGAYSSGDPDGSHHAAVYDSIASTGSLDQWYQQNYPNGAPVPLAAIKSTAKAYNVDPIALAATFQLDSSMGTKGRAVNTNNPGNVGNTETGSQSFASIQDGISAAAQNLANRQNTSTGAGTLNNGMALGVTGNPTIDATKDGYSTKQLPGLGNFTQAAIDHAAIQYDMTGQIPSLGLGGKVITSNQRSAIVNRGAELNQNGTIAGNKAQLSALTTSLSQQESQYNNVKTSYNIVHDNLPLLENAMKKGINNTNSPLVNQWQNAAKANIITNGDYQNFVSALNTVRAEYAVLLAKGGTVTDDSRTSARNLIPDNINATALSKVLDTIKSEGENVVNERQKTVQDVQKQVTDLTTGGGIGGSGAKGGNASDPMGVR